VYDILCAQDFNPNERTGFVFSSGNPRFLLAEQLRRAILLYYKQQLNNIVAQEKASVPKKEAIPTKETTTQVYQCKHCLSVYDESFGEPENGISKGTTFQSLPSDYYCPLCEAEKSEFVRIEQIYATN
jgi:rubredoxin